MNLTDMIESAMLDGSELVPWAEPNAAAVEDEGVEAEGLRALAGPVPPELAIGVPLLRFAATDAVPLIQAASTDVRHAPHPCARCGNTQRANTARPPGPT